MSYTIKNLRDVKNMAPRFGFEAVQEARFASHDLETEATGLAFHRVKPGCRQAFAHRHQQAEEVYVVLTGRGRMKLDDEIRDVGPMDAIRVSPTVARAFEADEDGLELLVFGPRHTGEAEIVKGDFWGGEA